MIQKVKTAIGYYFLFPDFNIVDTLDTLKMSQILSPLRSIFQILPIDKNVRRCPPIRRIIRLHDVFDRMFDIDAFHFIPRKIP